MKQPKILILSAIIMLATSLSAETENDLARAYVGLSGAITLPQGGSRLHRIGGAALRGGYYLTENWALEGEIAALENYAALAADALWHLQGWEFYGKLFGFSQFDPFITFGARGWIGDGQGQVGPQTGVGSFYHLTDNWSLRADADLTLGLKSNCEALYSLQFGVQYSF